MKPFTAFKGLLAPLDRANVDTDAIIPKQYLKTIVRTGLGVHAFAAWRYLGDDEERTLNPSFALNQSRFQGAEILLARENFGCGSSREHAVWALADYGFRVILAPSYADIFYNNCFKNGVLPIALPADVIDVLFDAVANTKGYCLTVDLDKQTITTPEQSVYHFDIDDFRKHCLLHGLDDIGLTLQHTERIRVFEAQYKLQYPWFFHR